LFLSSSTVEHPAVNRRVVGSNPTSGAKLFKHFEAASTGCLDLCDPRGKRNGKYAFNVLGSHFIPPVRLEAMSSQTSHEIKK
jgi:hypothetical protein